MKLLAFAITILLYSRTVYANSFSSIAPFFDREAYLTGKPIREVKSEKCPDDSLFISLDIETDPDKTQRDKATCVYPDPSKLISIEHVYENGEKVEEYSLIDGLRHGPTVSKYNENTYFLHRFCEGRISRSEVYDGKGNLKGISLHLDWFKLPVNTETPPDILITFEDIGKSVGLDKLPDFDESQCQMITTQSIKFNKWIHRDWVSLSDLQR